MFDFLDEAPFHQWFSLVVPDERIFVGYLLTSLILAYVSYAIFRKSNADIRPDTSQGFWKYVVGGQAYTHSSARQDYALFLVNAVIFYYFTAQFLLGEHIFLNATYIAMNGTFGVLETPVLESGWSKVAYTICAFIVGDFAAFLTHYFMHKNPVLWHFHKVHHSAEVLNPVTLYRTHPFELVFNSLLASLLVGIGLGSLFYLSGSLPNQYSLFGLNIGIFIFYLLGYNLRHSQIWLSWGRKLSHIFISPAQHQIHHSIDRKHWDKNMGLIFSFWDWMFGTIYVPNGYEKIEYGIRPDEKNPFKNVTETYTMPFKWAYESLKKGEGSGGFWAIIGVTAFFCFIAWFVAGIQAPGQAKTVFIEDLTWTEIAQAQQDGYNAVIIPTGGTEQNGAHVITGKHNYIVKHTAGKIAEKDGRTLVAPVIAYVPEEPHAKYPGTLSLPEKTYEDLLFAAGDSLLANGFKYVFFIGDSYGNQSGQANAAERLNQKWKEQGAKAVHIGEYYKLDDQLKYLEAQGYTLQQIGGHAGIRDTSEMLFVNKDGVRKSRDIIPPPQGSDTGSDGNYNDASKNIGIAMTDIKIDTAVKIIKQVKAD